MNMIPCGLLSITSAGYIEACQHHIHILFEGMVRQASYVMNLSHRRDWFLHVQPVSMLRVARHGTRKRRLLSYVSL